jgi:hypothetical protein
MSRRVQRRPTEKKLTPGATEPLAGGARLRADPLFLQRCVHESMRLHPASPVAWRRPTKRVVFECTAHPAGIELGPDDLVVLELRDANRDPAIFGTDAAHFNPHREIPAGHKPFGLSFGTGLHACLGQDLAAGLVPGPDSDPARHLFGTVPRLAWTLLQHGAHPDPADPATIDPNTSRGNWGRYPVRFERASARGDAPDNTSLSFGHGRRAGGGADRHPDASRAAPEVGTP